MAGRLHGPTAARSPRSRSTASAARSASRWTGYQVAWPMARGYEGQFGHVLNAPYVWIPLCLIFLAGLFDWRRPRGSPTSTSWSCSRFSVSHVFFNRGEIGVSVPLAYPPLALPADPDALDRVPRWRRGGLRPSAAGPLAGDRGGRPDRLPGHAQHRRLGRDRRRLRRTRSAPTGSRTASRSTARASSPTTTASATPTGRSTTTPTFRSSSRCRGTATGTSCPPHTPRRSSSTSRPSPASSSAGSGCGRGRGGPRARRSCSRSPGSPTRTPTSRCSRTPTTRCLRRCSPGLWPLFARPVARGGLLALAAMTKFAPLAADAAGYAACERHSAPGAGRRARLRGLRPLAVFTARVPRGRRDRSLLALPGDRSGSARPSSSAPSRASSTAARRSASGARWTASNGCRPGSGAPAPLAIVARIRPPPPDDCAQFAALSAAVLIALRARRRPLVLPLHPLVSARAARRPRGRGAAAGRATWGAGPAPALWGSVGDRFEDLLDRARETVVARSRPGRRSPRGPRRRW